MPRNFINWSCKLTLYQRDWDGGGGQPPVKSEVRAQSIKVGRLWFLGVDTREFPGGLLRLDPAFAYVEPPSSWPLPRVEVLTPAPATLSPWGPLDSLSTCLGKDSLNFMSSDCNMAIWTLAMTPFSPCLVLLAYAMLLFSSFSYLLAFFFSPFEFNIVVFYFTFILTCLALANHSFIHETNI